MASKQLKLHPSFTGPVDIAETPTSYVFRCDVPGMTRKELSVRVVDGCLELSGTRVEETTVNGSFMQIERSFGSFCRRFTLPEDANPAGIAAVCDHGVLSVDVPKKPTEGASSAQVVEIKSCEAEGDGSLNAAFDEVRMTVFPTPALGKIVVIKSSDSVLEAVKTLSRHRILSAPVLDTAAPDNAGWTDKYLGVVDMIGIVMYMLDELKPENPQDLMEEAEKVSAFQSTTIKDVADKIGISQVIPVDLERGSLLSVMLLCGNHGLRRVPVVQSPGGDIVNIITQSALVQTLHANLDRFKSVSGQTLHSLGMGFPKKVFSVSREQPLKEAFELIKSKDISAVAVTDADGAIKGVVSARDVRLVATSAKLYKLLNMPISVYLDVVSDGAENSAITIKPNATLGDVIQALVSSRIHRIFVVDNSGRPLRVVSLRDVIRKFVKEPEGFFGRFFG